MSNESTVALRAETEHCFLCGRTDLEVKKLIKGLYGSVCLECVSLCGEIVQNGSLDDEKQGGRTPFPSQRAEWLPLQVAIVCEPSIETLFALIETQSSNFLRPFSLEKGVEEHRAFRERLEQSGAKVYDLKELLTLGCDTPGPALERLKTWAKSAVRHVFDPRLSIDDLRAIQAGFRETLKVLDPKSLAQLILLRPSLFIAPNSDALDATSRFVTRFEVNPAHNSYYVRDPMITTMAGCVIGRLKLQTRQVENDIMEHALTQLGIRPIYRVQSPGHLEGGDFLPCGDFVLQGQGLLSDAEGIRQCLERQVYGFVEVAVVIDPKASMDEMHLDTYFALLDKNLCALCEDRIGAQEPIVTVYHPEGAPSAFYYRKGETLHFKDYLRSKGFRILSFSKEERQNYAPNSLMLSPSRLVGVRGSGEHFAQTLKQEGVKIDWLEYSELGGGYGGPHCSSQVLLRG